MSIIGMTACPEAWRERRVCYATMAHVTDYDVWHINELPVSVEMVVSTLKEHGCAQSAVREFVKTIPATFSCACHTALKDCVMTHPTAVSL